MSSDTPTASLNEVLTRIQQRYCDRVSEEETVAAPSLPPRQSTILTEINLEEQPLFLLGKKHLRARREFRHTSEWSDGKGRQLVREWIVRAGFSDAGECLGMFGPLDQDVWRVFAKFMTEWGIHRTVALGFVPYTELRIARELGLSKSGRTVQEIAQSVERFKRNRICAHQAFYYRDQRGFDDAEFTIFADVRTSRVERQNENGWGTQWEGKVVYLSPVLLRSLKAQHIKPLDFSLYLRCETALTKRLYALLDRRGYGRESLEFDLLELARWIPVQETLPCGVRKRLKPAVERLTALGVVRGVELAGQGIRFFLPRQKPLGLPARSAAEEALAQQMVEELGDPHSLGFYRKVARQVPREMIFGLLSEVRDQAHRGIVRSKAKLFTHMVRPHLGRRPPTAGRPSDHHALA